MRNNYDDVYRETFETNMSNSITGKIGEQSVAQYLEGKKYKVIGNNFRTKFGELDLITIAPDKTLVFVEVKFLIKNVNSTLSPEDNMTRAKIMRFKKISEYYAGINPELITENSGWRMDVVALECASADDLRDPKKLCEFRHYENIA